MVEIALALAVIGFALVAIIGVLPAGLSVQRENREQTVINLDAAFLMDAIRSGARGQDDLANYIVAITNTTTLYNYNGGVSTNVGSFTNWFTLTSSFVEGASMAPANPGPLLTNGYNIMGLLVAPKYGPGAGSTSSTYSSNSVTAVFRAMNGPAMDQGRSQPSRDFAFTYLVTIEIVPASNYPFLIGNRLNYTSPTNITAKDGAAPDTASATATQLLKNLYDIRLTFRWPLLPTGQLGNGRQVYRSSAGGSIINIPNALGIPNLTFNFLQPQAFLPQ
jgi:type II secretory pathway pseudopilin PulG